jgi:hypothetical protein
MAALSALSAQLAPQLDAATSGTASLADVGERWDATLANLQLELAGYLDQLAPVISTMLDRLLPVLRELADKVGPVVAQVIGAITRAFGTFLASGGASNVATLLAKVGAVASQLAAFVGERVLPVVAQLAGALVKALGPALAAAADAFSEWMPVLSQVWGFLERTVVPILTRYVIPALGTILTLAAQLAGALGGALAGALRTISSLFDRLLDWLSPLLSGLRELAKLAGSVGGALGGFLGVRTSRAAAPAGVTRSAGALRAGSTVNVYVSGGSPTAVVDAIRRYTQTTGGAAGFARAISR